MLSLPSKQKEVNAFIDRHRNVSIDKVALALSKTDLPRDFIIQQLAGLKIAKTKLPTWHSNSKVIYPPKLALEQCSSESTALYKSMLVAGKKMLDISAGFGVDSYFFSKRFEHVTLVEPQEELLNIVQHNLNELGVNNVSFINADATAVLEQAKDEVDLIYIDPSRRNEMMEKKHQLEDCSPNILQLSTLMLKIAKRVMIKTAPFLDLHQSIEKLGHVVGVHIIAVNNECKEVLYELGRNPLDELIVSTINLGKKEPQLFDFSHQHEKQLQVSYSSPLSYIYEPNAAIMKSGAFKSIASKFKLNKLHPNTHLYTSTKKHTDFPGKIFQLEQLGAYNNKFSTHFNTKAAIITMRNFPATIDEIKKKLKLKEGGDSYLIATTDITEKPILIKAKRLLF